MRRNENGFTLIEMLAVVVILAIVAGIGYVVVSKQVEDSKAKTDLANIRIIGDAVQRYALDKSALPADVNALVTEAYIAQVPADPWNKGGAYTITVTGKNVTITGVNGNKTDDQLVLNNIAP